MLKLNKVQKTITGKTVKPFTVQNDIVYCFDDKGNVIHLNIKEFSFAKEKKEKIIYVTPIEENNKDELFEEEEVQDGFTEEVKVDVPVVSDIPSSSYIEDDDYI